MKSKVYKVNDGDGDSYVSAPTPALALRHFLGATRFDAVKEWTFSLQRDGSFIVTNPRGSNEYKIKEAKD